MSKVFQVVDGFCFWEATKQFPTVESTVGKFPLDLIFVEAPDYVFEGWGYENGEFIQPEPPDGFSYDEKTGTFYETGTEPIRHYSDNELVQQQFTDVELTIIEMGQKITELELKTLGGN